MSPIRRVFFVVLQLVVITVVVGGTWLVFRAFAHGQDAPAPAAAKPKPAAKAKPRQWTHPCSEFVWVGPADGADCFSDLRVCVSDAAGNCTPDGDHLRLENPSKHDIAWSCDELAQPKTALLAQGQSAVRKISAAGRRMVILRVREKSKRCPRND